MTWNVIGAGHEPRGVAVGVGADLEGAGVLDDALRLELGGDGAQARPLLDDHGDRAADLAVGEVGARVADARADDEREERDQQVAEEPAAAAPAPRRRGACRGGARCRAASSGRTRAGLVARPAAAGRPLLRCRQAGPGPQTRQVPWLIHHPEVVLEQCRRGARVARRGPSALVGELGREALVEQLDGDVDGGGEARRERSRGARLTVLPAVE